jgi:hypothetical protein
MARITMQVMNLQKVIKQLQEKNENVMEALSSALYMEAENIMTKSKESYVPVRAGTLRASGYVESPKVTGTSVEIKLGYGGAAKAYALYIHEAPQNWNWSVSGTGPKYLEKPAREAAQGMGERLVKRLKAALK